MRYTIINQDGRIKQICDITGEGVKTIEELNLDPNLPSNHRVVECGNSINFSYFYDLETNTWSELEIVQPEPQPQLSLSELKENQLIIMDALATIFETMTGGE